MESNMAMRKLRQRHLSMDGGTVAISGGWSMAHSTLDRQKDLIIRVCENVLQKWRMRCTPTTQ